MSQQQILSVKPENRILVFEKKNDIWHSTISLENSSNKDVCFRIGATHPQLFEVDPNIGVLSTDEQYLTVDITAKATDKLDMTKEDTYCVVLESCYTPEDPNFNAVTIWNQSELTSWYMKSRVQFKSFFVYGDRKPPCASTPQISGPSSTEKGKILIELGDLSDPIEPKLPQKTPASKVKKSVTAQKATDVKESTDAKKSTDAKQPVTAKSPKAPAAADRPNQKILPPYYLVDPPYGIRDTAAVETAAHPQQATTPEDKKSQEKIGTQKRGFFAKLFKKRQRTSKRN